MKKIICIISGLLIAITCCTSFIEQDIYPRKNKTGQSNIPTTNIFLDVPTGYKVSNNHKIPGLVNENLSTIKVYQSIEKGYYQSAKDFTSKKLQKKGLDVKNIVDVTIDNYQGKIGNLTLPNGFEGFNMIFGNKSFSYMIFSFATNEHKSDLKEIKNAMLNLSIEEDFKIDTVKALSFYGLEIE